MKRHFKSWYGKIILFGEYGIILDSMALTIPFTHFQGALSFYNTENRFKYTDIDFAIESNRQIAEFANHLRTLSEQGGLDCLFDFDLLFRDIDRGLYFESSIPQSYGLGSSGALVAALYDAYAIDKMKGGRSVSRQNIFRLKSLFSVMESWFHGKSSGIDPLNAYIGFPLIIRSKEEIATVGIPRHRVKPGSAIFLVDTGRPGKTEPLVNHFLKKYREPDFATMIQEQYIPLTNKLIERLITGNLDGFFTDLGHFSEVQFKWFGPMIPENFKPVWEAGLHHDNFKLKLCGSGGGGYLLGFTKNILEAREWFGSRDMDIITVYRSDRE